MSRKYVLIGVEGPHDAEERQGLVVDHETLRFVTLPYRPHAHQRLEARNRVDRLGFWHLLLIAIAALLDYVRHFFQQLNVLLPLLFDHEATI